MTVAAGSLAASRLKLDKPERFDGNPASLSNWLFMVKQFCHVAGVTIPAEMVKVAVTLLTGKALTWWRAVSDEGWAELGICQWQDFCLRLKAEL